MSKAEPIANWLADEKRVEAIFGPGSPSVHDVRTTLMGWPCDDGARIQAFIQSPSVPNDGWLPFFGPMLLVACQSLRSASAGTSRRVLLLRWLC